MSRREALLVKSARSERTSALQQNPRAMADPVLHVAAGERLGLDARLLVRDGQRLSVLCHISDELREIRDRERLPGPLEVARAGSAAVEEGRVRRQGSIACSL